MYATPLSAMKSGGLLAAILFGVVCRADAHDCNDDNDNCNNTYVHFLTNTSIDFNFNCSDAFCYTLMAVGCVVAVFLIIMIPMCVACLCLVARGIKYLSSNGRGLPLPGSNVTANGHGDVEQNRQEQLPRVEIQGAQLENNPGPEYDTVQNERAATDFTGSHYFELEPPLSQVKTGGAAATMPSRQTQKTPSVLRSLQELNTGETTGAAYDELTGPGHPKATSKQSKTSAASLPPTGIQYASIQGGGRTEEERESTGETVHIYSKPDVTKKKRMKQNDERQQETASELRRSRTMESFFSNAPQSKTQSLADLKVEEKEEEEEIEESMRKSATPSPPPPMLPPKPGHRNILMESDEDDIGNTESLYSEASSKPLQPEALNKGEDPPHISRRTATITAMGVFSPRHTRTKEFSSRERDLQSIPRSFSTMGHGSKRGAPSVMRQEAEFRQLYDMPLDLFLTYRDEDSRRAEQTRSKDKGHDGSFV